MKMKFWWFFLFIIISVTLTRSLAPVVTVKWAFHPYPYVKQGTEGGEEQRELHHETYLLFLSF